MPAKHLTRINGDGIYLHIYNKGIENRAIFNDEEDYRTFLGFLEDYLTTPKDPASLKREFKVNGKTFQGTPHQPKNYYGKVELIAYSLMPNHFHLLLYQLTKGAVENFIRSLCTRYSIYFNKKYSRTGPLFPGPYKSASIDEVGLRLSYLTRFFHFAGEHSSYPEYLATKVTSWVKPGVILALFNEEGKNSYKDFVDHYRTDNKLMAEVTMLEDESDHLAKSDLTNEAWVTKGKPPKEEIHLDSKVKPHSRLPQFMAVSTVLFVLLLALGVRNIVMVSAAKDTQPLTVFNKSDSAPAVLSESKEEKPENSPETKPKSIAVVKTEDGSATVNIRQEATTSAKKIGKAKDGDSFETISILPDWFEIKLPDGSSGFISAEYIDESDHLAKSDLTSEKNSKVEVNDDN